MLVVIDQNARPKEGGSRYAPNMEPPILEDLTLNTILRRPVVLYAEEGTQE